MNIREFKPGDVITRNAPMVYAHSGDSDGSYLGKEALFVGFDDESKIIVLKFVGDKEPYGLSFARDAWDEGWAYYPKKLFGIL